MQSCGLPLQPILLPPSPLQIHPIRNKRKDILIEVDGGINDETINKIRNIADIAVVGSYITKSNNYEKAINNLKN